MPYTSVFIHYVWSTRYRKPVLSAYYRQHLFDHIRATARRKGIYLDKINGHNDHVHCLICLQPSQSMSDIAQQLKGESAYWFNRQREFQPVRLEWQKTYFAVAVGLSSLNAIRAYIDN